MLGNLWVVRTAELSEGWNDILLSDLKSDAGASGHMLDHGEEFGEDSFVDFKVLFGCWKVDVEDFHC